MEESSVRRQLTSCDVCGSVSFEELEEGIFVCNDCGTESQNVLSQFLDKVDVPKSSIHTRKKSVKSSILERREWEEESLRLQEREQGYAPGSQQLVMRMEKEEEEAEEEDVMAFRKKEREKIMLLSMEKYRAHIVAVLTEMLRIPKGGLERSQSMLNQFFERCNMQEIRFFQVWGVIYVCARVNRIPFLPCDLARWILQGCFPFFNVDIFLPQEAVGRFKTIQAVFLSSEHIVPGDLVFRIQSWSWFVFQCLGLSSFPILNCGPVFSRMVSDVGAHEDVVTTAMRLASLCNYPLLCTEGENQDLLIRKEQPPGNGISRLDIGVAVIVLLAMDVVYYLHDPPSGKEEMWLWTGGNQQKRVPWSVGKALMLSAEERKQYLESCESLWLIPGEGESHFSEIPRRKKRVTASSLPPPKRIALTRCGNVACSKVLHCAKLHGFSQEMGKRIGKGEPLSGQSAPPRFRQAVLALSAWIDGDPSTLCKEAYRYALFVSKIE